MSMSRCRQTKTVPVRALTPSTLVKVVLTFVVIMGFCLGHLHLRFSLAQVRRETSRLQALQGTLASEINALSSQAEALQQDERLYDYAHNELGMVEYSTAEREVLRMPQDVYSRYAMARSRHGQDEVTVASGAAPRREDPWLNAFGDRVGLIGQAVARESQPEEASAPAAE